MTTFSGIGIYERQADVYRIAGKYAGRYSDWPENLTVDAIKKEANTYSNWGLIRDAFIEWGKTGRYLSTSTLITERHTVVLPRGTSYYETTRSGFPVTTYIPPSTPVNAMGPYREFLENRYREIKIEKTQRIIDNLYDKIQANDSKFCGLNGIFRRQHILLFPEIDAIYRKIHQLNVKIEFHKGLCSKYTGRFGTLVNPNQDSGECSII